MVIDTASAAYGEIPTIADPVKPDEGNTVYNFTGWEPTPAAVTGDAEYTATFTSEEKTDWGMLPHYIDRAPDNTETVITLTKNYTAQTTDTALIVPENKKITLDLGEYTIDRGLKNSDAAANGNIITNNGTLTLTGTGTLTGGNNTESGGAISAHSGVINMSGGEIRNNEAKSHGGGIYLGNSGTKIAVLNLTGGSVTVNRATNNNSQGGGILNNGFLNVSGNPTVNENYGVNGKNVYLRPNHPVNVTGTLAESARFGVTIEGGNGGVITLGLSGKGVTDNFFSDSSDFHIILNDSNEAELVKNSADGVFAGNNLALNGDITVNFYIDPTFAGVTPGDIQSGEKGITVEFAWSTDSTRLTDLTKYNVSINQNNFDDYYDGRYFKVSCNVAVAEMSCQIKATAYLNGFTAVKEYSVREYGSTVLDSTSEFSVKYINDNGNEKYAQLVDLVTKMLDYGAKAQKVFKVNTSDLANSIIPEYQMGNVSKDMCIIAIRNANEMSQGDDMNDVAVEISAEYYSTSLVYLSKCTFRNYFTFNNHPEAYEAVKDELNDSKAPFYFVEKSDIPAAELDKLQTFKLGGELYYYSALNFAGAMIESENASADSKNLAMALYWYNQAANDFFE